MNINLENLGTMAALIGVVVVYWQGRQAKIQNQISLASLKEVDLRLKKESAYTIIERWSDKLDKAQPAARSLVNTFDYDTCVLLKQRKPLKVDAKHKYLLTFIFQNLNLQLDLREEDGSINLNIAEVAEIHYLVISHLNSLEIALFSWRDGTADRKIIEEQLSYVVINENKDVDGEFFLEHFRNVVGGEQSYPAIHEFINHLGKKHPNNKAFS